MFDRFWDFFVDAMIALFMPAVCSYYAMTENLFLNTAVDNANGFEKVGNFLLIPTQYLFSGKEAILLQDGSWNFRQRFDYHDHFWIKTLYSIAALPTSLVLGSACKAVGYLSSESRERHTSLLAAQRCTDSSPLITFYQQLGIDIQNSETMEWMDPQDYLRRPEDANHLQKAKEALAAIGKVLNEAQIPWWVDCGTCLGVYRYGGVIPWDEDIDIGIFLPDFENARRAFNRLDPKKYQVQDWSGRSVPHTLFKIFIKEDASMIDVDCFLIEPESHQMHSVFALEESIFFPEWFKIRERRFSKPVSFDTVFPLKKALFDGVEVFVPNQTKKYLQRYYGENLDPVKIYNPNTHRYEKDGSHPYWKNTYVH